MKEKYSSAAKNSRVKPEVIEKYSAAAKITWAQSSLDLDGRNGFALACWVDVRLQLDTALKRLVLDESVEKVFGMSLAVTGNPKESIDRERYVVINRPGVVVFAKSWQRKSRVGE